MPTQNASEIKERVMSTLRRRGPSLPVHISNEINSSILFSSAFLADLVSEKKIKMSHMRVGSSPIYYIPGQEDQLEKFSDNLRSKEKDAFFILKEKKFLEDSKQEPAIRIALREIKDFAKPFNSNEKLIWRYFTIPEEEFSEKAVVKVELTPQIENKETPKIQETILEENLDLFPKQEEIKEKPKEELKKEIKIDKKPVKKTPAKPKSNQKSNEKFFNKIKEFLNSKNIEITDIVSFDKNELALIVNENSREIFVIAFNKKRISDEDILNAHKKSIDSGLEYKILCLGEPAKKTLNLIEAIKSLSKIENIEN